LLLATNVPKIAVALSIIPVLVYAQLAGNEVATLRSVVMGMVFFGAVVVDRRRHLLVSLAAAAVILIANTPGTSQEISFQLSFAAVLGLIVVLDRFWPWWLRREEEHLMRLRGWRGRLWRSVALYFAVSIAALAATTPLGAFYFNQVSAIALLANAVVVPLLGSIAVALGLTAALIYWILPPLASLLVWAAGFFIDIGIAAVRIFAAIPLAAFTVVTPTKIELALLYTGMLAGFCLGGRRRAAVLAAVALLSCIDIGWWWRARLHDDELRVTFLSVGQGDSAVVEFPGGAVLVVDGGGLMSPTFDVGERIIAPYLWSRRIATIDYLVVTHPQWDHYGGFGFLSENFAPRQLWSAETSSASESYSRLLERLRRAGTRFQTLGRGDVLRIGGVDVTAVAPAANAAGLSVNDRSLVLSLSYGRRRVLLTGDIEAAAERLLVQESGDELRSVVLKVPHHGSATSSTAEFVAAVRPGVAVVSAGADNRYGFPARRVIGRYAAVSSQVLRTDLDGAVEVRIRASGESWVRAGPRGAWSELAPIAD
jgi:competence protein ComEC